MKDLGLIREVRSRSIGRKCQIVEDMEGVVQPPLEGLRCQLQSFGKMDHRNS